MKKFLNFFNVFSVIFGIFVAIVCSGFAAQAQQESQSQPAQQENQSRSEQNRRDINAGTVRILTAGVDSGNLIHEIATTLNKTGSLRVLPVLGDGGVQNINDILYLRGIDMGVVRFDMLDLLSTQKTYGEIEKRVRYVAKLFDEEIHLIARRNISDITQLSGLRVNFGDPGSGTFERADRIFKAFGVSVVPVSHDSRKAIGMVASGEIAATLHVGAKPSPIIRQIDPADGLHLLSIPASNDFGNVYSQSSFQRSDYPNLIREGDTLSTISVGSILVVYRWNKPNERSAKVDNFVRAFFDGLEELQQSYRHPKWKEVALSAEVPGWRRTEVASNLASSQVAQQSADDKLVISAAAKPLRQQFERFLDTINRDSAAPEKPPEKQESGEQLENLLTDFLRWRQQQTQ